MKIRMSALLFFLLLLLSAGNIKNNSLVILYPRQSKGEEVLAARELQRYLYLRLGEIPDLRVFHMGEKLPPRCIVIGSLDNMRRIIEGIDIPDTMGGQEYFLRSANDNQLYIVGGSPVATLYGAYKFLESTGIGFSIDEDIIPDKQVKSVRLSGFNKIYKPSFRLRGILPFHDFPEGPDWWNENDYKAVITQLPKMGMNFIGFHTYPVTVPFKGFSKAEPLVWIGLPGQFNPDGTVKTAYPALHSNNRDNSWGYYPKKTSDYSFGASQIFGTDYYGTDYMKDISKWPHTPQENIEIFNKVGKLLNNAFTLAKDLGVKTCAGTEIPLTIPSSLKKTRDSRGIDPTSERFVQEVYEGMFSRIKVTYPLDYYWFWTPESWTWQGESNSAIENTENDLRNAEAAAKNVQAPFTLATCGWVLGPSRNRAEFDTLLPKNMPFSCINRNVGNTPVDTGFKKIKDRPKWEISWLEDDPGLTAPQFWAGRVLKDGLDAYKYGCTGFMGIHWRTKILSPAFMALSYAGWDADQMNESPPDTVRDYPANDLYLHWAKLQFGEKAAQKTASIFIKLDGSTRVNGRDSVHAPRPATWNEGPGLIQANEEPWRKVEKSFSFIHDFENYESLVVGKGDQQRYQYWLNTFYYTRAMAKVGCILGQMGWAANQLKQGKNKTIVLQQAARLLSLRDSAAGEWGKMETYLLGTINTTGAMGTISNLEDHSLANLHLLTDYDSLMGRVTDKPTPALNLPQTYVGKSQLIVTTRRTLLRPRESLDMKVRVLTLGSIESVKIYWKPLGIKKFKNNKSIPQVARNVYQVHLASDEFNNRSFEYYIEVKLSRGRLIYPVNAPVMNQTVVIW